MPFPASWIDIQSEQVVFCLASDDDLGAAVAYGDDGRPRHVVVVAGHRAVIRPGRGDRNQVTGREVAGQRDVLDDDVAGLAVLTADRDVRRVSGRNARRERGGVVRVVQRGADVVAHAAVDADVGPQAGELLDRADFVERDRARADERTPGLDRKTRYGEACVATLAMHDLAQALGRIANHHRKVRFGIGNAEAPTEVELLELHCVLGAPLHEQADHAMCSERDPLRLKDLRADVRMYADELERRQPDGAAYRFGSCARGQREPELLVLLTRGDVLMCMRLDAGGDSKQDALSYAGPLSDEREPG